MRGRSPAPAPALAAPTQSDGCTPCLRAEGVRATATKLVLAVYFCLSIILVECYSANLAAFLTVTQLQANVQSLSDLRGQAVGTADIYKARLARRGLATTIYDAEAVLVSFGDAAAPGPRMTWRAVDSVCRCTSRARDGCPAAVLAGGRQHEDLG